MEITPFEATPERRQVVLKVDATRAPAGLVRDLAAVVREFPGEIPVLVAISTSQGETTLALGPDYTVKPEPDFFAEVKSLLGEAAVA
jgi:DNA polymerase-3 subunit alpha